jgi:hypothetical protein
MPVNEIRVDVLSNPYNGGDEMTRFKTVLETQALS